MANRRMFSLDVVDTDLFLEMPSSSQALYFHLGMRADDDGFVSSPKKITKMANCAEDDLKVLTSRGFILPFENGIVVITHWKRNNYIRSDRYTPTLYQKELSLLSVSDGIYSLSDCIPNVNHMVDHMVDSRDTQDRLVKDRLVQVSSGKNRKKSGKKNLDSLSVFEQKLKEHNFSEDISESVRDWIRYKQESGFNYKETGLKNLLKQIDEQVRQHGGDSVCRVIQESIASGWKGIAWNNLEHTRPQGKEDHDGKKSSTGYQLFK